MGAILLCVAVIALFVFLIAGKVSPAVNNKGDEIVSQIDGTSTSSVGN